MVLPTHQLATYRFLIPICGVFGSLWLLEGEHLIPAMVVGGVMVSIARLRVSSA